MKPFSIHGWLRCLIIFAIILPVFFSSAYAQSTEDDMLLGTLSSGGQAFATKAPDGNWGIRVDNPGSASFMQDEPVIIYVRAPDGSETWLSSGYMAVERQNTGIRGTVSLTSGMETRFEVTDSWSVEAGILEFERRLTVEGGSEGGFISAVYLSTEIGFTFPDVDLFFPGMIYGGGPDYLRERAPAGPAQFAEGLIVEREDGYTIPVAGIHFRDGTSAAILSPKPDGRTVVADTQDRSGEPVIEEQMHFGGIGAWQNDDGGISLMYWYPGYLDAFPRLHPLRNGFSQHYSLSFRFGRDETFHQFYTGAWRWGWETLHPVSTHYDLSVVQRALADVLVSDIETIDGRTGMPFMRSTLTGEVVPGNEQYGEFRWWRAIMGFVGKNLESAALIIQDSYEDQSSRGETNRVRATDVIDTFARVVVPDPPDGAGFNMKTGEPSVTNPAGNHITCCSGRVHLREFTDGMRWVLNAYEWEKDRGRTHDNWLTWVERFGNWLLAQQNPNGGIVRSWIPGTDVPYDTSYTSGYNAMAYLTRLSQVTGESRFLEAAERAGDFMWDHFQRRERFVGGTIDNPDILDKEAATLSLEGYLALYEETQDAKWLNRARAAADFAETWIYAWSVPMPEDEDNNALHWKKGVSTIGLNRINSHSTAGDQWMAGDVDEYARLYKYTGDEHYLAVARILLHSTKNMLALPGRQFDLLAPGWQQEHFRLTLGRGYGGHRNAFPWVQANHLTGIMALKEFDRALYDRLAAPE